MARMGRRGLGSTCAVAAAIALGWMAAPAGAVPSIGGSFDLAPEVPGSVALGPDGNAWVLLSGGTKELARVTPSGVVTEFDLNFTNNVDVASAPDGKLWISRPGGVTSVDPATGTPTDFAVATINGARGIVADGEGDLWVVDDADGLVEVGPNGVKKQDVAIAGASGREIAKLGDGAVAWVDFLGGRVFATPTTGTNPTSTPIALDPAGGPQGIAASPTGFAISNPGAVPQYVQVFDPTPTKAPTPGKDPFGVAYGTDEAYWFANFAGNDLGRLPKTGDFTSPVAFPAGSGPRQIARGAGSTLWVGLETSKQLARIDGVDPPAPPAPPTPPATTPTPPATPPPAARPFVLRVSVSPNRFRTRGRRPGSRITVGLSLAGQTTFTFRAVRGGRRVNGRCVAPTRVNRGQRACTRRVVLGSSVRSLPAGASRIAFRGRVGGRPLRPGRYEVLVRAAGADGVPSATRRARFAVVR